MKNKLHIILLFLICMCVSPASGQNNPPIAQPDLIEFDTAGCCPKVFNLLLNDSDPDGNTIGILRYTLNGQTYAPRISPRIIDGIEISVEKTGSGYVKSPTNFKIEYTISDGKRGTATAIATFEQVNPLKVPVQLSDQDDMDTIYVLSGVITCGPLINVDTITSFHVSGKDYPAANHDSAMNNSKYMAAIGNGNLIIEPTGNFCMMAKHHIDGRSLEIILIWPEGYKRLIFITKEFD